MSRGKLTKYKLGDKFITSCFYGGVQTHMHGQTLILRSVVGMQKVNKEDCLTIEQAAARVGSSKATLYNYMNILGVQRLRFPFDRRTYVMKVDVERIKQFIEESKG